MHQVDLLELGNLLRKRRKELNYILEELADENISASTISNIELGKTNVADDRRLYLIKKLDLDPNDIPMLLSEQESKSKNLKIHLESIEHLIDLNPNKGWQKLKKLKIGKNDPLLSLVYYLKGKYYIRIRDWEKARKALQESIRIIEVHPELEHMNLKSASLHELSRVFYYSNNTRQAIRYTVEGINSFSEDGERTYYKHLLWVTKAFYLENLGKLDEVVRITDELWPKLNEIRSQETVLNLFEIKTKILIASQHYEEAILCTKQGLEISRLNRLHERSFDMWSLLGKIYLQTDQYELSEDCFLTALEIEIKKKSLLIPTYTYLGRLYILQNRMEEAKEIVEKAVQIGEETNSQYRLIDALTTLGDCYQEQEKLDQSIEKYQTALSLAKEKGSLIQEKEILFRLCKTLKSQNYDLYVKYIENYFAVEVELQASQKSKSSNGGEINVVF